MLFNSLDFAWFLPVVFILYWFVCNKSLKIQNALLVVVSYVFYGWWDWRFLTLIFFSTVVDFVVAKQLLKETHSKKRKRLLAVSLVCNLGLLGVFKYYNFFVSSWIDAWQLLGVSMAPATLNVILPVGISFYTFQTLSYTIDVYKKRLKPTSQFVEFAAFVAFFPQLVAGPIERASRLLPQFQRTRKFDYTFAISGFYLIIWGLFKKMVIADNCAFFVNQIFEDPGRYTAMELLMGSVLFAFQIYGDFSGYSDIAIGVARLFGFSLMTNFTFPYFSRNIAEFWRRWHISLSTWFRDYLYIPLGGSRGNIWKQLRNVFVVFLVSGFWHGANWTFVVWGGIHALLFLPLLIFKANKTYTNQIKLSVKQLPNILVTFVLVCMAWVFFRADNISIAINIVYNIFSLDSSSLHFFYKTPKYILVSLITSLSIGVMLFYELKSMKKGNTEVTLGYYQALLIAVLIVFMGVYKNLSDFIYFQF
ncbi:MBOAT family O-acyltransferase [Corallibacter sp.]|uniref:MBOAT family O-acyltransferase n=1 Tax=Corallibacter sp. TaxID=2038084 RepID=UPI003AB62B15